MKDSHIIKRIWLYAKPFKAYFFVSYIVLLVELFLSQILPILLKDLINYAVYDSDLKIFFAYSFIIRQCFYWI